jgi:DNA invertase Pin-like site-specific DNA recombinase
MTKARSVPKLACAVYTRKSTEEGLEQEFNSLQAQREACEAYIESQRHEGWLLLSEAYDDGGVSGGTLARPALQQLLTDIEAKKINVVVVYKVDRLTRSLADFAKIVETFDRHGVSFVSVTQQFNTTTSMGRLTLNVLLSFAQFEREVTGERIRDKFLASRQKGLWMGGHPPLGYDLKERKLHVNEAESELVRRIFTAYADCRCIRTLRDQLHAEGAASKQRISQAGIAYGGMPFSTGALYKILGNRTYLGLAVHKDKAYPGEHPAIIDQDLWDRVHTQPCHQGQAPLPLLCDARSARHSTKGHRSSLAPAGPGDRGPHQIRDLRLAQKPRASRRGAGPGDHEHYGEAPPLPGRRRSSDRLASGPACDLAILPSDHRRPDHPP